MKKTKEELISYGEIDERLEELSKYISSKQDAMENYDRIEELLYEELIPLTDTNLPPYQEERLKQTIKSTLEQLNDFKIGIV